MKITLQTKEGIKKCTVEEIAKMLDEGKGGMLNFTKGYKIDNYSYYASALTLYPNETKIFERDEKLIVTAYFREYMLHESLRTGDDERLVPVECELHPNDLFIASLYDMKTK